MITNEKQRNNDQFDEENAGKYIAQREYATKGQLSKELAEEVENDILIEQLTKDQQIEAALAKVAAILQDIDARNRIAVSPPVDNDTDEIGLSDDLTDDIDKELMEE
jgi:hypothetical protein